MKQCTSCNSLKPMAEYSIRRDTRDGFAASCRACCSARNKAWRLANPDKVRELEKKAAAYRAEYKKRPERVAARQAKQATPAEKARRAARMRKRRVNDPKFAVASRMTCLINSSLRKVGASKRRRSWQDVVGYTLEQLRAHLEAQFLPGMSWENIGKWHIDHIVPVAAFKFTSVKDAEFLACWALSNLRPLWDLENRTKGARREFLL